MNFGATQAFSPSSLADAPLNQGNPVTRWVTCTLDSACSPVLLFKVRSTDCSTIHGSLLEMQTLRSQTCESELIGTQATHRHVNTLEKCW